MEVRHLSTTGIAPVNLDDQKPKMRGGFADYWEEMKRTPIVWGNLLWQPFDVKFQGVLERMKTHQHNISEEVKVWKLKTEMKEHTESAKWREHVHEEHKEAAKERELANEERRLMYEERRLMETDRIHDREARQKIASLLSEIRTLKDNLEQQRLGKHIMLLFDKFPLPNCVSI